MKSIQNPLLLFSVLCLVFISCKKDNEDQRFCWQLIDASGNQLNEVCGKTAAQMQNTYGNACSYYKSGPKFCWLVNGTMFVSEVSEDGLRVNLSCFNGVSNYTTEKVNCNYCQKWFHRLKKTYKPDNSFSYSSISFQQFCGDTAKTLYQGRQIIEKETADSLIVRQFSNNGTSW